MHEPLVRWTQKNYKATLAQDRQALSELAREFEGFIDGMLESRRQAGARPQDDLTAALMHEKVWGRSLSNSAVGCTCLA